MNKRIQKIIATGLLVTMLAPLSAYAETNKDTEVTGIDYVRNNKAGVTVVDRMHVKPGYGREVKLQMYNSSTGKWVTKQTTHCEDEENASVKLTYTKDWYSAKSTKWRVYVPATDDASSYTSKTITMNAKRVYQNPSGYFQIQDNISFAGQGDYNLKYGSMGLKVRKVQQKLGMSTSNKAIIGPSTSNKIKAFQKKKGLSQTGVVDYATWRALGLSYSDWVNLGAYTSPIQTDYTSTKQDCIEAMIDRAYDYLGTEYIVGASGKPGQGVDCSGLVMQALYASGINPTPVSVIRHSQPGYEYESRNLFKSSKFKKVSYANRKRGDLIFYSNSNGVIIHIAIYLGNNKVIEAWPGKVVVWPIKNSHRSRIAGVRRVFN